MKKFVFVHIPKATGTSLRKSIEDFLGIDLHRQRENARLLRHFFSGNMRCIVKSFETKKDLNKFAFGHFYAGCYGNFNGLYFAKRHDHFYGVMVREPLQRAISHYFYWKRIYAPHPTWEKLHRENWSLEEFLLGGHFDNFQSRFFWRFPIHKFDYVGLSEHYEESVRMLSLAFPPLGNLAIRTENVNPEKVINKEYQIDSSVEERFKRQNSNDYCLYEQAVKIFERQKQQFEMDVRNYE